MSLTTPGSPPDRPRSYLVFDVETNGLNTEQDRIWEVVVVDLKTAEVVWNRRYRCERPPELVAKLGGPTTAELSHLPGIAADLPELSAILAAAEVVIGYNPFFDRDMIDSELARVGLKIRWPYIVCAKRVWDQYEPKDRSLQDAFKRFVDRAGFDGAHGALADVMATVEVLKRQIGLFGLENVAWSDMDPDRKLWWMGSHHVLVRDDVLVCNFGKNNGVRISMIEHGFWRWLITRDFPRHVLKLALEATRVLESKMSPQAADGHLLAWALAYKEEHGG